MTEEIAIRAATEDDIPALVQLRRLMFESMGHDDPPALDAGDAATRAYLSRALPANEFRAWLAVTPDGEVVSSGGLVIDEHPPGPSNLCGRVGYIMNVVTVPPYRRRGLARRIMGTMLNWLSQQGIPWVTLHASETGRPLYEQLGFRPSNELRLQLESEPVSDTHSRPGTDPGR